MRIDYRKFFIACSNAQTSMRELLNKSSVSFTTLSKIKHNKPLQPRTIGKLAAALGVPAESLLADE